MTQALTKVINFGSNRGVSARNPAKLITFVSRARVQHGEPGRGALRR
jgi:hypothetical protein